MRRRAWATAGVLVCACALAAVWQSPRRGTAARVELELASDQRAARLRADLTRLARDIDDADRRRRGAGGSALERTNASGRQNARARLDGRGAARPALFSRHLVLPVLPPQRGQFLAPRRIAAHHVKYAIIILFKTN